MKPWRISLFIFVVLGVLLLITLLSRTFGVGGLGTEEGFGSKNFLIKYPSLSTLLDDGSQAVNLRADSVIKLIDTAASDPERARVLPDFSKIDTSNLVRISYPAANPYFTGEIKSLLTHGNCRILHFGDSQLEGDRISGYLRNRLQSVYGGSGPGFIPIKQVYEHSSAEVVVSDNWLRFASFDPTQKKIQGNDYGLYASFSRFTSFDHHSVDSITLLTLPDVTAQITIRPSKTAYAGFRRYNRIGLHYGNLASPVKISVKSGGGLTDESWLIPDESYHCFEILSDNTPSEVTITLDGKVSPDFYGLTLDGNSGISLDNIAMRGASGTVFSSLNPGSFSKMAQKLQAKLLIFQYGGNTVPYAEDSTSVRNYCRYIAGNIHWVLKRIPEAKVIFIGPADMSTMINGKMQTYPLLPYLDHKLKETCNDHGWAYWSTYEAMGGENAMLTWVEQGLAASDYTHFSPRGTRIISELFFTALYLDLK